MSMTAEQLSAMTPNQLKSYLADLQAQAKAAADAAKQAQELVKAVEATARSRQSEEARAALQAEYSAGDKDLPVLSAEDLAKLVTAGATQITVVYPLAGDDAGHGQYKIVFAAARKAGKKSGESGPSNRGSGSSKPANVATGESVSAAYARLTSEAQRKEDGAIIEARLSNYRARHPEVAEKDVEGKVKNSVVYSVMSARLSKLNKAM